MMNFLRNIKLRFFEDKNLTFLILFFLYLNLVLLSRSREILIGGSNFNAVIKYAILVNNTVYITFLFSIFFGIYNGAKLIKRNLKSGQMKVILSLHPHRTQYLLSEWFITVTVQLLTIALAFLNVILIMLTLNISFPLVELISLASQLFVNSIMIMTIALTLSLIFSEMSALFLSSVYLMIFNIYAYDEVPFVGFRTRLSYETARVLASVFPINSPTAQSIVPYGYATPVDVVPYLIREVWVYQLLYTLIVMILGLILFKRKEL